MIVPELIGYSESASIVYRNIVNALQLQNRDVKMIVASSMVKKVYDVFAVDYGYKFEQINKNREINRRLINENVEIEYILEPIETIFDKVRISVEDFMPECIIDATDENIPVCFTLINDYPILYYPMRTCTSGYCYDKTINRYFGYNPEVIGKNHDLPDLRIRLESNKKYSRKEYFGLNKDGFLVVTVGGRFYSECDSVLIEGMLDLLRQNLNMHWIIVGVQRNMNKGFFDETTEDIIHKVHFVVYENDLPALYKMCDVFLNPDRVGGGLSMLFAMQEGLAVAALKKNYVHGAAWVGEENLIDGSSGDLCRYIEGLYNNKELLKKEKEKMINRYMSFMDEKEWGKILSDYLDEMVEKSEI